MTRQPVPTLTPPGSGPRREDPPSRAFPWLWLLAALLLALLLAVVLLLPPAVNPTVVAGQEPGEPPAPVPVAEHTLLPQQKAAAEAAMEGVMRRRAELQAIDVGTWAVTEYQALAVQIEAGDVALDQGYFEQAVRHYQDATRALDELERSRPERFATVMQAGQAALTAQEGAVAAEAFHIALALQPESAEAQAGLQRAEVLDRILELIREGEAREQQGDLSGAVERYRQAVALDVQDLEATKGLERVEGVIRTLAFRSAMSEALGALEQGDTAVAGEALKRAKGLNSTAPALRDAELRLTAARRAARLKRLQRAAAAAAKEERWSEAERLNREALKLDPSVLFGRQGEQLARQRLELLKRIDRYLGKPERLQAKVALENARELLQYLQEMDDAGPRLRAKRDQLSRLVESMQQQVTLRLLSDGETSVVIYRVGRLGQFQAHEIELRPGRYTLVGSRDGFRDVRHEVTLRPGPPVELNIRCEERI